MNLPSVVEVADNFRLDINERTRHHKEVRAVCPFCDRQHKNHLSLNTDKNVFKCWFCGESGGVMKFMALLDGKSEKEVIERYRKKHGSDYERHPAEKLTRYQLSLIGYPKIDWVKNREHDYHLYKAFRETVYLEWKAYVKERKKQAYRTLFLGLTGGWFQEAIEKVENIETEVSESFKEDLLESLFQESKNDDMYQLEKSGLALLGKDHPYDTLIN